MKKIFFAVLGLSLLVNEIKAYFELGLDFAHSAINPDLFEEVLNPKLCAEQLRFLQNDPFLLTRFIESGLRIPRGILTGNTIDFGNYYQCLGINEDVGTVPIEGKYCSITVPLNQNITVPFWMDENHDWTELNLDFDPRRLKIADRTLNELQKHGNFLNALLSQNKALSRNTLPAGFTLAVCIPKPCTTQEGINGIFFNLTAFGFRYEDNYCRLNEDKPWSPADYVSITILLLLTLVTCLSTGYDLWITFIRPSAQKQMHVLYSSFSLYTNCHRLTNFNRTGEAIQCVDGIRALSITWVILGHSFSTLPLPHIVNILEGFQYWNSMESIWVASGAFAVDTFFMLSGLLLVYTTAGKLTGVKLLKNLHLFYLNRILRMFPTLAMGILLQASLFHYIADGPLWEPVTRLTHDCRNYWWATLIYLQNYLNTDNMCLPHTWYLAIDMQLHILSPLILFWILSGSRRSGWLAIAISMLCICVASTTFISLMEFPGNPNAPSRLHENRYYMRYYYINTLTRALPFLIGMAIGYLLHVRRGKKLKLSKLTTLLSWIIILGLLVAMMFANVPMFDEDYDNQMYDNVYNSFVKSIWAAAVGALIFICVQGYGGPINWFLSLPLWKLPSRLSYGVYIYHFSIMTVTSATALHPVFFSVKSGVYRFLSELLLAMFTSFVLTLFVESPFSKIFKIVLEPGSKKEKNNNQEIIVK